MEEYPKKWAPVYDLLAYSESHWSKVLATENLQKEIITEVIKLPYIHLEWNSEEVENKILELMTIRETKLKIHKPLFN